MSNFNDNGVDIIGCGAYMWNGSLTGSPIGTIVVPLPTSIRSFNKVASNDSVDYAIVYPGFAVEVYDDAGYITKNSKVDNTNGNKIMIRRLINSGTTTSVKVFYRGVQVTSLTGIS